MTVCPLCNGFSEEISQCPNCSSMMEDKGRFTDYFDDYSAYMDIDVMKLFDGMPNSLEKHQCLHLLYCSRCGHEHILAAHD
ncbi:hypothetical protein GJU40_04810 [Bacillus lacus]|uniref:Uncharacterized protein n=2 Tax=Metabacillus lacus TaxID=1983721 RepID=A0A7X2LWI2_9BACI|nr:hypothetical protein [Metabacillus lacus]MRX71495.1 hypothetical protein [Metabacillus lacus]